MLPLPLNVLIRYVLMISLISFFYKLQTKMLCQVNLSVETGTQRTEKPPIRASPLCHVCLHHSFRGHLPGAVDPTTRQPLEIKLAADLGVGAARVRHVVAVERHHVAEDVCARSRVCRTETLLDLEVESSDFFYLEQRGGKFQEGGLSSES